MYLEQPNDDLESLASLPEPGWKGRKLPGESLFFQTGSPPAKTQFSNFVTIFGFTAFLLLYPLLDHDLSISFFSHFYKNGFRQY